MRQSRALVCTVMWSIMPLPDEEDQFRPNHFALICHRQTKAACNVDLTADNYNDKEGDNIPDNADSREVVGDDGSDKRMGNGKDVDHEQDT